MKLHVQVREARGLRTSKATAATAVYTRLHLGNTKAKSSISNDSVNPSWFEDFSFHVDDLRRELRATLWEHDRCADKFLGKVKVTVSTVLNAERQTIPSTWYTLEKRSKKSKSPVFGEICLGLSLYGKTHPLKSLSDESDSTTYSWDNTSELKTSPSADFPQFSYSNGNSALPVSPSLLSSDTSVASALLSSEDSGSQLGKESPSQNFPFQQFSSMFPKNSQSLSRDGQSILDRAVNGSMSEESDNSDEDDSVIPSSFFEDDGHSIQASRDEMPPPLSKGTLLDQRYAVSVKNLNATLFRPGSQFIMDLVALQKTTDYVEGPWKRVGEKLPRRIVTYMKAPTAIVKSVMATEDQAYLRADEKGFVVSINVSTPDVPYGSTFRTELQFCLFAEADLAPGKKASRLCLSWRINFLKSTMMKGMIENGALQGLKANYKEYSELLQKYAKPIPESLKASLPEIVSPKNDWALAKEYFLSLRACLGVISFFVILLHISFARTCARSGLEVLGIDLPDTFTEFISSAIVGIQIEHVLLMVRRFLQARVLRASDHGVKAKGDGWLLAVTLVSAESLPGSDDIGLSDPYVVFTCNGKRRTSSVKLRNLNPEWKEIFEFDATEDPPSTMDVEVFDFEGPFTAAESLGHTEINFLKQTPEELCDLWVPLQGRNALACGSRVHLRISLTNSKEVDTVAHYIKKVEEEIGKKISRRSPQKNLSFQRLFLLPSEEFLINDFSCALKRKLPLQGRLFVSPRLIAFYSNVFGRKTKLAILWEDIEEIRETSPALRSVGMVLNPAVLVFTRKGRAMDVQDGAKSIDTKGRLKFQFQSFVHFGAAFRTITALWKNRKLSPEQQMDLLSNIEEKDSEFTTVDKQDYDYGTFLGVEEAKLLEVYSTKLPLSVESMSLMYERDHLDEKIAEKLGCMNYTTSPWVPVGDKDGVQQRQINYNLNPQVCHFGSNVTCIQQRSLQEVAPTYVIDEVLTFHDVPYADHFQIQVRKEMQDISLLPPLSACRVLVGIAWQKSTVFQPRISKNIFEKYTKYLKESLEIVVKEIMALKNENQAAA
eukprot:c28540_g1_i2 orf=26-3193(+)